MANCWRICYRHCRSYCTGKPSSFSFANTPAKLAFNLFNPVGAVEDKPPIIFIHGVTSSKYNWYDIPQKAANATRRRAYAVDLRNHGDSEWKDYVSFDCNVDDLLHFMDSMKVPKAVIVGHSKGAIIGIKTALRKPERVDKLVVEESVVRKPPQSVFDAVIAHIRLSNKALENVPAGADEETAKKFIVDFVFNNVPDEFKKKVTKQNWTEIELKRTENGRYAFRYNARALEKLLKNTDETLFENTGVYERPSSFIYGKLSPHRVGKDEDHIKQFFPNAEFVGIENATHRVHTDCPAEFTEVLLKFILKK